MFIEHFTRFHIDNSVSIFIDFISLNSINIVRVVEYETLH